MYTVYMDGKTLHSPNLSKEYWLDSAVLTEELNTQGSFKFSIPAIHSLWEAAKPITSRVWICRDGVRIWRGRIASISRSWNNTKVCHAEGDLALFRDSTMTPFMFSGSPTQLLTYIVNKHNGQMDDDSSKKFTVGSVTVVDPNNTIVRSNESAINSWNALNDKCFGSSLGGYIVLNDMEVSWLADFTTVSTQKVRFGENLIDLAIETNAENIITCLIPYGAKLNEGDPGYIVPTPSSNPSYWTGNRLTVADVNDGRAMLVNSQAVNKWGRIVSTMTWDDITIASNLKTAGTAWLNAEIARSITSIKATAADLSLLDSELDEIGVGMYVPVESRPHLLDDQLLCTMKSTNIIDPSQTSITLGVGQKPLTSMVGGG